MNAALFDTLIALFAIVLFIIAALLVIKGWRGRAERQTERVGELPAIPEQFGQPVRGPHTCLYIGSTFAPSWQDRVAAHNLSDRSDATIAEYPAGILICRSGVSDIWIPAESVTAVRTERGIAGKVMTADGVLVIRWRLPNGTELDTGVRADDKTIYPAWVAAYDEVTSKTRTEQDRDR